MSRAPSEVPVFSLKKLEEDVGCSKGALKFLHTIHRSGFFYLKDHGIATKLIEKTLNEGQKFFDNSVRYKSNYICPHLPLRGYTPIRSENTALAIGAGNQPDLCEKYTWTENNVSPSTEFTSIWDSYQLEAAAVCRRLLRLIGKALGMENLQGWREIENGEAMIRQLFYPEWTNLNSQETVRMAGHCDIGSITLLYQTPCLNQSLSLEAEINGIFRGIPPSQDCFIVNLGETLSHITNGMVKATKHRVVCSQLPGNERTSLATFYFPNKNFNLQRFFGSDFQGHYRKQHMVRFQELIDEIAITFCNKSHADSKKTNYHQSKREGTHEDFYYGRLDHFNTSLGTKI